jgi:hypothetical protein
MPRLAAAATAVLVALSIATACRAVGAAAADGFRKFLPGVKQPIYHFTSWRWALLARRFDPARPTSLLPARGQRERWRETRDGKPLLHVMAFESDDPKVIWGGGAEHDHMHQ